MASEDCHEDSPLLKKELERPVPEKEGNPRHNKGLKCRLEGKCCYVLELCFAMYVFSNVLLSPISQFYVYDRISMSYGISNYIHDDAGNACHKNNSDTINNIQKDASQQLMYMSFLNTFLAVIPIFVLGNMSDKYGRKVSFLLTLSGLLLHQILYIIVLILEAPLPYLFLGSALEGITGYVSSAVMVAYIMLADITSTGKDRGFRIALMDGLMDIAGALATLGGGFMIKYLGFLIPLLTATGVCLVTIVVWILFVPETKPLTIDIKQRIFSVDGVRRCFVFYFEKSSEKRRGKMVLLLIIFLLAAIALPPISNVTVLFLLNQPFCWTELHITIVSSVQTFVNWPIGILLLRLLQRVMSEAGLLVWGCFFGVASLLPLAFAYSDWMIYLYMVAATLTVIIIPITRSILSKLTSPDQQGALFGGIAAMETLVAGCGALMFGEIYQRSVEFFPGLVFLICCGLFSFSLILSGCLYRWMCPSIYVQIPDH